jgi:hypothetical protein
MHPIARRIFAIPNGGLRTKIQGAILKAEGVRPGVPDLMLPVARGGACGLFVEMKYGDGRVSREQAHRVDELVKDGYACLVAWGAGAAIEYTQMYIDGQLGPGLYIVKPSGRSAPVPQRTEAG